MLWGLALVAAFADGRWRATVRLPVMLLLAAGQMITLVRAGWIMTAVGIAACVLLSRSRGEKLRVAASVVFVGVGIMLVSSYLPGGDFVADRAQTLGDLRRDHSFNSRVKVSGQLLDAIFNEPIGVGIGFRTSGKLAGTTNRLGGFDNGYGELFLTFGLLGAMVFLIGVASLMKNLQDVRSGVGGLSPLFIVSTAQAALIANAVGALAVITFVGVTGAWTWLLAGLALASINRERR
jgi:hypothetical protein